MSEQQDNIAPHPRHELHDRIYTGTHAARLIMEHDAEAYDIIAGYQEDAAFDPGDHVYFLKRNEIPTYNDRELYDAASPFTRQRAGMQDIYPGVDYDFKSWLMNDASNGEIVNFFQSALHNLRKTAITPETEALVETEFASYARGIEAGEREGWLAAGSAQRIRKYKEDPGAWQWGTSQMRARPRAEAWSVGHISAENHSYFRPQVVFPAGTMSKYTNFEAEPGVIERKIKTSGFHEFNHAFLGGFDPKWVNEAVTEHVSRVLRGEVDIEGKGYSDEIEGSYGKEIKLLLNMINRSQEDMDTALSMKDVTLAYSSLDKQAVKDISERFKQAIGFSFEDVDEYLASRVAPYAKRTEGLDTQSGHYIRAIDSLTVQLAA